LFSVYPGRKRLKRKNMRFKSLKNRNQQTEEPVMEVNWDEIENRYVEIPTHHTSHFTYTPQLSDVTSTIVDSTSLLNSLSPMLVKKRLRNPIDENDPYGLNKERLLQKPDGV
jgi:DNA mismatch repair ATPase MutS